MISQSKIFFAVIMIAQLMLLASCQKEEVESTNSYAVVDLHKSEQLNGDELGVYTSIFDKVHHGNIKIHLTKNGELFRGELSAKYLENPSIPQLSDGGTFQLNDLSFNFDGRLYSSDKITKKNTVDYISNKLSGKTVNFKNEKGGRTLFDEEMYLPEVLRIENLEAKAIPDTRLYRMDRHQTKLQINQDLKNTNGLLVLLSYNGEFLGMEMEDFENLEPTKIFRALHLPQDKSVVELPSSFFEDIPSNGIATLYIARGNVKEIRSDNKEYLVRMIAQEQIRIVL